MSIQNGSCVCDKQENIWEIFSSISLGSSHAFPPSLRLKTQIHIWSAPFQKYRIYHRRRCVITHLWLSLDQLWQYCLPLRRCHLSGGHHIMVPPQWRARHHGVVPPQWQTPQWQAPWCDCEASQWPLNVSVTADAEPLYGSSANLIFMRDSVTLCDTA